MERTTLNVPPSYNIVIRDLCGPPTINRQVQVSKYNQNILIGVLGESTRIISKLRKYFNVFHEVNNFVWLV